MSRERGHQFYNAQSAEACPAAVDSEPDSGEEKQDCPSLRHSRSAAIHCVASQDEDADDPEGTLYWRAQEYPGCGHLVYLAGD